MPVKTRFEPAGKSGMKYITEFVIEPGSQLTLLPEDLAELRQDDILIGPNGRKWAVTHKTAGRDGSRLIHTEAFGMRYLKPGDTAGWQMVSA